MKRKQILLLAVVLAMVAAVLMWSFLSSLESKYRMGAKEVPVLVARSYIPESTNINAYMVRIINIPQEYIQPNALTSPQDLLDKEGHNIYFTIAPIREGEQILATKLVTPGEITGLALAIPKGKRAVSIAVDSVSGVADLIKSGDYVDVLGTFDYTSERKGEVITTSETVTILQHVLVLACGREIVGAKKEKKEKAGGIFGGTEIGQATVTLAVTPVEAEIISFSREKGTLSLALRPTGETEISSIPKIGFDSILKGEGKPVSSVVKPPVMQPPDMSKVWEEIEKARKLSEQRK